MKRNLSLVISFFLILFSFVGCTKSPSNAFTLEGKTQGTTYHIKGHGSFPIPPMKELQALIEQKLQDITNSMSTYKSDSEIENFNNLATLDWYKVTPEFAYVTSVAKEISEITDGAYDVTIGPLVNLWGFGPKSIKKIPTEKEILEIRKQIGYKNLLINDEKNALKKNVKNLRVDLSSIAQGYTVDQIASLLEGLQVENYMVEIGGEVFAKGVNFKNAPWSIGIENPNPKNPLFVLPVRNFAVSTSGDYRNYFEENGVRYSHTIDPHTGKPITHKLASVTVVMKSAILSDGWSTALTVLGPIKGLEIANKLKIAAYFLVRNNDQFEPIMSDEFAKQFEKK